MTFEEAAEYRKQRAADLRRLRRFVATYLGEGVWRVRSVSRIRQMMDDGHIVVWSKTAVACECGGGTKRMPCRHIGAVINELFMGRKYARPTETPGQFVLEGRRIVGERRA